MRIKGKSIFGFIMLGIILMLVVPCLGYSFTAKIFPLIVGAIGLVLITLQLIIDVIPAGSGKSGKPTEKKDLLRDEMVEKEIAQTKLLPTETRKKRNKEINIFTWVIGLIGLIYLVGYLITVPLFIFLFLKFRASASWLLSITLVIVMEIVIYIGFMTILHIPLYKGLVFLLIFGR